MSINGYFQFFYHMHIFPRMYCGRQHKEYFAAVFWHFPLIYLHQPSRYVFIKQIFTSGLWGQFIILAEKKGRKAFDKHPPTPNPPLPKKNQDAISSKNLTSRVMWKWETKVCVHESGSRPKFFWMPSRVEFQVGGKIAAERTWQRAECHLEQCAFKSVKRTILLIWNKNLQWISGELHTSLKSIVLHMGVWGKYLGCNIRCHILSSHNRHLEKSYQCFNTIYGGTNLLIREAWHCAWAFLRIWGESHYDIAPLCTSSTRGKVRWLCIDLAAAAAYTWVIPYYLYLWTQELDLSTMRGRTAQR